MKNNIYFLIRSLLISLLFFLLLPFISFAQSLAPIPDVGPGVCVGHCGSDTKPTMSSSSGGTDTTPSSEDTGTTSIPPPTSEEEAIQAVQDNIQNATDLDDQALQKIDEGDYPSVPPIIDDATQSLTDARDSLKTDPDLEQLRGDEPKALSKIDRSLQSSIKNHKKVSSTIDRIVTDPNADEGLLSKLLKKAKRYLSDAINGRRKAQVRTNAIAGIRG